jgi:uncharacterized protein (DUF1684 family)
MTDTWDVGDGSATDRLWLADWRRQIAALYAEVRAISVSDPAIAHAHWRAVRERLFREHPQSPVPAAERADFAASHFEYDPAYRFEVHVAPIEGPEAAAAAAPPASDAPTGLGLALELPNSGTDTLSFSRIGTVSLPLPDGTRRLTVFWMAGYSGGLFVPFRDGTNGTETYGAGRYLVDAAKSADLGGDPTAGAMILDFNFAFQPSCAFDPRWACPLAPPENRLDIPIRAGERLS